MHKIAMQHQPIHFGGVAILVERPLGLCTFASFGAGPFFFAADTRWQQVERGYLLSPLGMHISKCENIVEAIFAPIIVSAACLFALTAIFKRTKKHIPERKIGEIFGMTPVLMMYPVRLRSLNNITQFLRRPDIPMIEILRYCSQESIKCATFDGETKESIHNKRT